MSRYQRSESMGIYWYNKASDLRGAAGLVWAGIEDRLNPKTAVKLGLGKGFDFGVACWPVYLMLCGLALELLIKAAIVAKEETPKRHHRLGELWEDSGLRPTAKQRALLKILSESTYWAGRYPVPTTEADYDAYSNLIWEELWKPASTNSIGVCRKRSRRNRERGAIAANRGLAGL
jgi:HEPN domain-containing protein